MLILKSQKLLKFESNDTGINNLVKSKSTLQVKFKEAVVTKDHLAIFFEYPDLFDGSGVYTFAIYIKKESMLSLSREFSDDSVMISYTRAGYIYNFQIFEEEEGSIYMTHARVLNDEN